MNEDWKRVETDAVFPVGNGSVVEVRCSESETFRGSQQAFQVTCVSGDLTFEDYPECGGR